MCTWREQTITVQVILNVARYSRQVARQLIPADEELGAGSGSGGRLLTSLASLAWGRRALYTADEGGVNCAGRCGIVVAS